MMAASIRVIVAFMAVATVMGALHAYLSPGAKKPPPAPTAQQSDRPRDTKSGESKIRETQSGEIKSGEFAKEWIAENKTGGRKKFLAMRESQRDQKIERVGAELRQMMTFLKKRKEAGVPQDQAAVTA